jgi:hypothetical protein
LLYIYISVANLFIYMNSLMHKTSVQIGSDHLTFIIIKKGEGEGVCVFYINFYRQFY